MTMKSAVALGFRFGLLAEPLKVKDFRTGRKPTVRTSARFQNEAGREITVPVTVTFGRPEGIAA